MSVALALWLAPQQWPELHLPWIFWAWQPAKPPQLAVHMSGFCHSQSVTWSVHLFLTKLQAGPSAAQLSASASWGSDPGWTPATQHACDLTLHPSCNLTATETVQLDKCSQGTSSATGHTFPVYQLCFNRWLLPVRFIGIKPAVQ